MPVQPSGSKSITRSAADCECALIARCRFALRKAISRASRIRCQSEKRSDFHTAAIGPNAIGAGLVPWIGPAGDLSVQQHEGLLDGDISACIVIVL